jgi:SAM-dependent methyltransferase
MSLAALESLWPILRCPVCRAALTPSSGGAICDGIAGRERHAFSAVGSHPILVDFADSVLSAEDIQGSAAASLVPRRGATVPFLGSIIHRASQPFASSDVGGRTLGRLRKETPHPRILVVGGGTAGESVHDLYRAGDVETVGFDVYASPLTQFVADAHSIPVADGSFDGVWIQAVLEHVVDPYRVVSEIHRVLRGGGLVFSEMPFMQQVHEGPYDFVRLTERGHRWLFRRFEEVECGVVAGPGVALSWSIDHYVRSMVRSRSMGRLAGLAFIWLAWLEGFMGRGHVFDSASAFYFVGTRSETALTPRALVSGYRGAQRQKRS